ncbi:unnamed protein product [Orchesella dallaii]|uniref:Uncharacterized protein n=1 Tax=Orchesella dallaii TaxID=48710 RepID=A0ABP1R596_9HEXA
MQGSIAITQSPAMMENFIFRQKLGLSCRQTIDNNNGSTAQESVSNPAVSRCLFGLPDPKLVKDLVREIELKNALSFGKRFNFDIIQGEPFPGGKVLRKGATEPEDNVSDEENIGVEEDDGGSYMWTESYDQDYMAKCNNHASDPSLIGPNRRTVSLLFAPIVANHQFSSSLSSASSSLPSSPVSSSEESPIVLQKESSQSQCESTNLKKESRKSLLRNGSSLNLCNNRSSVQDKNQVNTSNHHLHPHLHNIQHQPSAKKSSSAHQIIAKYTSNLLRHALNKKPRKSLITDYLKARRRQHQLQKKRTP